MPDQEGGNPPRQADEGQRTDRMRPRRADRAQRKGGTPVRQRALQAQGMSKQEEVIPWIQEEE